MNKIRITAVRQTIYHDLIDKYENPIEHTCDVREGQQWISVDGQCPEGMCLSAWSSMREFVESLAKGEGHFFAEQSTAPDGTMVYHNGWMKNPMSAMISCNDGAELDYFDLTPTPPVNQHFDLMAGEVANGFVGERFSNSQ